MQVLIKVKLLRLYVAISFTKVELRSFLINYLKCVFKHTCIAIIQLYKLQNAMETVRMTMPLVSYIRISLRFWHYASLSTCCQNLDKKLGSPEKFGRKQGGQTFMRSN